MTTYTMTSGVTSSGLALGNGDFAYVSSGGTTSNTLVGNGGTEVVSNGGVAAATTVTGGGYQLVFSGGVATGTTISNGGYQLVSTDGVTKDTTIGSGAEQYIAGVASGTVVRNGGVEHVFSGGAVVGTSVESGGSEHVLAGGLVFGTTVHSGGTAVVYSGAVINGLVLNNGGSIDLQDIAFTSGASVALDGATDILTVSGASSASIQLLGSYVGVSFQLAEDIDGSTLVRAEAPPCFCRGTRILTERGAVAVEDLTTGDRVVLRHGGGTLAVRWIGHRQVRLATHARPWDVQPVRVQAHAFGPGLPQSDLRLSPDHAVFAAGVLVPVRYLVNGATIVQEAVATETYYHVELAADDGSPVHDILLAEGLPVESYLDTGNRSAFVNGGSTVPMHPDFARAAWDRGCAPLMLAGTVIENVRVELLAQATTLGFALSTDPALHLVVDGAVVEAERDGVAYRFAMPAGARDVRLVSRTTIPAEARPDGKDTRRLGVAVTRLLLDGVALPLTDPRLTGGWYRSEVDWRWTSGNAALPIASNRVLEVSISRLESYWICTPALARRRGAAAA